MRLWARQAITRLEPMNAASMREIVRALQDPDTTALLRARLTQIAAGWLRGDAEMAAEPLVEILREASPEHEAEIRWLAVRAARVAGAHDDALMRELVRALIDDQGNLKREVLDTLAVYGAKARAALPDVLPALKDADATVRAAAARAVTAIGDAKDTLPASSKALADDAAAVREAALDGLATLGAAARARPRPPKVRAALTDAAGDVRAAAARALTALESFTEDDVTALLKALKDSEPQVRAAAAAALGRAGALLDDAATLADALITALGDDAAEVRAAALRALAGLKGYADQVLPAAMKALATGEDVVREAALEAVALLGEQARVALPVLRRLADSDNATLAALANKAIAAIER
ncbi:MAG: HEAT repeat domain-containing protein [Myxococcales bacterium]|nr:HEAT repeat domain-containing protein [Myxococcales bacterium]